MIRPIRPAPATCVLRFEAALSVEDASVAEADAEPDPEAPVAAEPDEEAPPGNQLVLRGF